MLAVLGRTGHAVGVMAPLVNGGAMPNDFVKSVRVQPKHSAIFPLPAFGKEAQPPKTPAAVSHQLTREEGEVNVH
jgi:hypothetical protein